MQICCLVSLRLRRRGCEQGPRVNCEIRNGNGGEWEWETVMRPLRVPGHRCPRGRREGMFEPCVLTSLVPDGRRQRLRALVLSGAEVGPFGD